MSTPDLTPTQADAAVLVRAIDVLARHRRTVMGWLVARYLNRLARELLPR